jgi:hypothetical protein
MTRRSQDERTTPAHLTAMLLGEDATGDVAQPGLEQLDLSSEFAIERTLGEHLDGGLGEALEAALATQLAADPELRRRLEQQTQQRRAREGAFLERLRAASEAPQPRRGAVGEGATFEVEIDVAPPTDSLLFESRQLMAAAELRGGSMQVADRTNRVQLAVEQFLTEGTQKGALEVRIRVPRDRSLWTSQGVFEVLIDGRTCLSVRVQLIEGRFRARIPFDKQDVGVERARYRLRLGVSDG